MRPDWKRSVDDCAPELTRTIQIACEQSREGNNSVVQSIPRCRKERRRGRFKMCKEDLALWEKHKIEFRRKQTFVRRAVRKYLSEVDPRNPFGPHFDWIKGKTNNHLKMSTLVEEDGTTTTNFAKL